MSPNACVSAGASAPYPPYADVGARPRRYVWFVWSLVQVSARDPLVVRPPEQDPPADRSRERGAAIRLVSRAPLPKGHRPRPEYFSDERPTRIERARPHAGRREDRARDYRKVTRAEREALTLETLGVFRVVSRRSLVDGCYDGHPFAASRVLAGLERRGLIAAHTVEPPERQPRKGPRSGRRSRGYQVFTLTGRGRDVVAGRRRDPARSVKRAVAADDQVFWQGLADIRQLQHDHYVFDAVAQETREIEKKGGHVRRVRLEHELRGLLAAAEYGGRKAAGDEGAAAARRGAAVEFGLRPVGRGVPLPDAVVEIEHADGSVSSRSIEVTTTQYSSVQVAEKRAAGFRLFIPGGQPRKERGGGGRPADWEEFPLSWGR